MNISGPSSYLRLFKQPRRHQTRDIQQSESSSREARPVTRQDRRRKKDRRRKNIQVLSNRRRPGDRRNRPIYRHSPEQDVTAQNTGNRINTRA